jgi:LmbE family N-acetylglucosaminyl deacetylase
MVVAAHPDDEVLGCGGTIARHVSAGDDVHVLILAEGAVGRRGATRADAEELRAAARQANELLGVRSVTLHDYPGQRMDSLDRLDVTQLIESHLEKNAPAVVYAHFWGDVNADHVVAGECTIAACRPVPQTSVQRLLFFEVASSTEWAPKSAFQPNWFIDVTATFDRKMQALQEYELELRAFPHPRSEEAIRYLAGWRGATAGLPFAEAFMLSHNIDRSGC